jgi:uncharacterized NAD(P)/FAD-binding protein YdhS
MSGLYTTLEKIKKKPALYLGRKSLQALYFFLEGYEFSREELGIESTEEEVFFYENFQEWLQSRFQVQTVSSWAKIIQLYSIDDRDAFDNFFSLLDQFLSEKLSECVNLSEIKKSTTVKTIVVTTRINDSFARPDSTYNYQS